MTAQADYLERLEAWKAKRLAALKAPDGWLNIVGRWVLDIGPATVGAGEDNDLVLPVGPARLGTVTQNADGTVTFAPTVGAPVTVTPNKNTPPRFTLDRFLLEVTTLNGQNALRIRDTQSTAPDALTGIDYFAPKPEWRIVAHWSRFEQAKGLTIGTTGAIDTEVEVTHKATFTHDGATYELIPTPGTPEAPQFVIRDQTSRDLTYPASRFVYGEDVTDSTIVLDFNKAINPPCSFTEFAVCPLPPPQNVLPFRIEAGEKRPSGH
jgi:uncharacterized protein (DUF1684 family)